MLPALPARREVRIDLPSALLASAGMAALVYGLGEAASAGWGSGQVIGSLATAAAALAGFACRQVGKPATGCSRCVWSADRNRGGALIALIVNSLSTFGMMLILTYQLQAVMGYSALRTGLALVPFAIGAALAAAVLAPRLAKRIAPRWLIAAGIVLSAAGLLPLVGLTPASRYLPLILTATSSKESGPASAAPRCSRRRSGRAPQRHRGRRRSRSTASQLGSSIGAALLNTIAATATAGYLATHAGASVAATVHGYTTAMAWGAGILLVAAIPAVTLINAKAPSSETVTAQAT